MGLGWQEKQSMLDNHHPHLSLRKQCQLLGLNRSNLYYQPMAESQDNLDIMKCIDEEYTRHPFIGARRMRVYLRTQGYHVNLKRIRRL